MVHHQDWPELSEDALQREVTAREVELRVLRKDRIISSYHPFTISMISIFPPIFLGFSFICAPPDAFGKAV